jgi:TRAP-type C4-dicarboxylate transport system substrate-binding protein
MNKDKWNAIPPDAQKVIDEINEEYAEKMAKLWENLAEGGKEFFVQQGGKVIVLSKEEDARWTARIRPVVDKYVTELNSKGLPGDEALKICKDYLKAHQK